MNTIEQKEVAQWLVTCVEALGEDTVLALVEHGYYMALEENLPLLATYGASEGDSLLETPLKSKPEAFKKHTSLFELEAKQRSYINLVVNNK